MNREILRKKLSIGHNGTLEFFSIMEKYHEYIGEVYFAPASWVTPSTRPNDMTSKAEYTEIIKEHMKSVQEKNLNIKFSLLLNSQCWNGEFRSEQLIQKIRNYIELLEYRFDDIVVSDLFLAKVLKPLMPEKTFTTSVISALNDIDGCIEFLKQFSDFETICVGHKLTYDISEMKNIKEVTGKKIKLLINQGCYYHCPDYVLHSTALAHTGKFFAPVEEGKKLYCDYVNSTLDEEAWKNLTHQALSPENIGYYSDVVDVYKLSTRIESDINRIDKIIGGYIFGDKNVFAKNLFMGGGRSVSYDVAAIFSLVEYPKNYIEVRNRCKNRCYKCTYCKTLWDEAVKKFNALNEENRPSREMLNFKENVVYVI